MGDRPRRRLPCGAARRELDSLPDITRPDVGAIMVSEWIVGTPERQRATVETFAAALERAPWPDGLLSANFFASTDGTAVLLYGQWTSDEAYNEYVRVHCKSRADELDAAVPGIERRPAVNYRLYRSTAQNGKRQVPGCLVIVNVEFDGPDPNRQRQWVDTVFDALESETDLPTGGISGHFHVSTDGTRVLNYAEWTDEKAHIEALERSGGSIGAGPKWQRVRTFPGIISNGVKRCHFRRSLAKPHSTVA
jgi:Antibiotic biosynthesis monooxygenase